jgi:peptidoglycan/LPS O-acetylase OafA/YrhL
MSKVDRGKLIELEALRGVAAMMVLLHHFLLVVAPRLHGRQFPDDPIALVRTPLYALVNGTAAVSIFFVLSGFVLTFRVLEQRDWSRLLVGAFKRWPRLIPLVATVNVLSAIFVMLGLYQDRTWFGAGAFRQDTFVIASALAEGAFWTFFNGSADFNSSIWTMHYELFGNLVAYATALVMIFQKSFRRAMAIGALVIVLVATTTGKGAFFYAMPVAGVLVARLYVERNVIASALNAFHPWRVPIAVGTAGLAVVLCGYDGYSKPVGFYAFMVHLEWSDTEPLVHGIAAVAMLALVLFCGPIRRSLAGPTAALMGRLSFPIYLVHLPVLIALVSPVHSYMAARFDTAVAAPTAFVLLVTLTLAAAYPLARLDEWWVRKLRELARLMLAMLPRAIRRSESA